MILIMKKHAQCSGTMFSLIFSATKRLNRNRNLAGSSASYLAFEWDLPFVQYICGKSVESFSRDICTRGSEGRSMAISLEKVIQSFGN
ncbi:hypothetical protein M758_12G082000 [Ceratodon purpureus]|nr:hypothetical protein M758_12G082000 [Ceratodon purpureus]